jgi:lipopolysaccharide transport system ATP-binding protein
MSYRVEMAPIIEIRGISKQYRLGEASAMYGSFREALVHFLRKPWARPSADSAGCAAQNSFWALRDVSFDVHTGETIGIIGSNGAGKSTLLKILSRIVDPTEGCVKVRGKLASLLEVGTGFHPELTGRENIYLNGSILGMRKDEIDAKFEDIASFSGIETFLDTPVKRYSSGMYVRLAFAIAAHMDPEILIVDEVLAVGDVAFQRKCLGKMAEARSRARTVIFVSHNLAAVESLCDRGVVLHQGAVVFDGPAKKATEYYLNNLAGAGAPANSHVIDLRASPARLSQCRPMLSRLELYTLDDQPFRNELGVGGGLKGYIQFNLDESSADFDAWIGFDTMTGLRVCTAHSAYESGRARVERAGEQEFAFEIDSLPLVPGEYKICVGVDIRLNEVDWVEDAARLTIVKSDYYGTGIIPTKGTFLLQNRWRLERKPEEVNA